MAKGLPHGIYEKVPGSKIHWIRYNDASGKERREKCGTLTAAKTRLDIRRAERHQGHQAPQLVQRVSFSVLVEEANTYAKSENDAQHAKELSYKFDLIQEDFASVPILHITKTKIMGWLDEQEDERQWSAATRNRYQAAWSFLFRVAIENKRLKENPAAGIKRRREDNQRVRWLSLEEEWRLTDTIGQKHPNYVDMFLLALHVGPRKSELLRMRAHEDYNPTSNLFRVRQKKVRALPEFRYVPATPIALAAYQRLSAGKPEGFPLCSRMRGEDEEALRDTRYWFDPCVASAGIQDFHWHDLRHSFASRLVMGGRPLAEVMHYMGHQSIQMTMRYAHLMPENHSAAVDTMMNFYRASGTEGNGTGTKTGTGTLQLVKCKRK